MHADARQRLPASAWPLAPRQITQLSAITPPCRWRGGRGRGRRLQAGGEGGNGWLVSRGLFDSDKSGHLSGHVRCPDSLDSLDISLDISGHIWTYIWICMDMLFHQLSRGGARTFHHLAKSGARTIVLTAFYRWNRSADHGRARAGCVCVCAEGQGGDDTQRLQGAAAGAPLRTGTSRFELRAGSQRPRNCRGRLVLAPS